MPMKKGCSVKNIFILIAEIMEIYLRNKNFEIKQVESK